MQLYFKDISKALDVSFDSVNLSCISSFNASKCWFQEGRANPGFTVCRNVELFQYSGMGDNSIKNERDVCFEGFPVQSDAISQEACYVVDDFLQGLEDHKSLNCDALPTVQNLLGDTVIDSTVQENVTSLVQKLSQACNEMENFTSTFNQKFNIETPDCRYSVVRTAREGGKLMALTNESEPLAFYSKILTGYFYVTGRGNLTTCVIGLDGVIPYQFEGDTCEDYDGIQSMVETRETLTKDWLQYYIPSS